MHVRQLVSQLRVAEGEVRYISPRLGRSHQLDQSLEAGVSSESSTAPVTRRYALSAADRHSPREPGVRLSQSLPFIQLLVGRVQMDSHSLAPAH